MSLVGSISWERIFDGYFHSSGILRERRGHNCARWETILIAKQHYSLFDSPVHCARHQRRRLDDKHTHSRNSEKGYLLPARFHPPGRSIFSRTYQYIIVVLTPLAYRADHLYSIFSIWDSRQRVIALQPNARTSSQSPPFHLRSPPPISKWLLHICFQWRN